MSDLRTRIAAIIDRIVNWPTWKFNLVATVALFVFMTSLFCLGHLVVHGSWPSWQ